MPRSVTHTVVSSDRSPRTRTKREPPALAVMATVVVAMEVLSFVVVVVAVWISLVQTLPVPSSPLMLL